MSVVCYFRPGSKQRIVAGDMPKWISNNARASYIAQVCLSYPPWVDRYDMNLLRAWAQARSVFTGELHVLDHIIPVSHPMVCGLSVPWNFQVVHWRVNGAKGNRWHPEQLELFERQPCSQL